MIWDWVDKNIDFSCPYFGTQLDVLYLMEVIVAGKQITKLYKQYPVLILLTNNKLCVRIYKLIGFGIKISIIKYVNTNILVKICAALECDISDIVELTESTSEDGGKDE